MDTTRFIKVIGVALAVLSILSVQCSEDQPLSSNKGEAQLVSYSNSDCLEGVSTTPFLAMGDSAEVEVTVEGLKITVIHSNAIFNCCIDSIRVEFAQEDSLLKLTEIPLGEDLCDCICPFEVSATIEVPSPGIYIIEIWAEDEFIWRGKVEV
jgi:hypothetical protein